jgi:hypothetical protein
VTMPQQTGGLVARCGPGGGVREEDQQVCVYTFLVSMPSHHPGGMCHRVTPHTPRTTHRGSAATSGSLDTSHTTGRKSTGATPTAGDVMWAWRASSRSRRRATATTRRPGGVGMVGGEGGLSWGGWMRMAGGGVRHWGHQATGWGHCGTPVTTAAALGRTCRGGSLEHIQWSHPPNGSVCGCAFGFQNTTTDGRN